MCLDAEYLMAKKKTGLLKYGDSRKLLQENVCGQK